MRCSSSWRMERGRLLLVESIATHAHTHRSACAMSAELSTHFSPPPLLFTHASFFFPHLDSLSFPLFFASHFILSLFGLPARSRSPCESAAARSLFFSSLYPTHSLALSAHRAACCSAAFASWHQLSPISHLSSPLCIPSSAFAKSSQVKSSDLYSGL
jgi:hypothetical protein